MQNHPHRALFSDHLPTLEHTHEDYRLFRVEHCASPSFRFSMICPKAWRCTQLSKAAPTYRSPMGDLLRMESPDGTLGINVAGVLLQKEIDAGDWFAHWLKTQNERVLEWREAPGLEGRTIDCLTEQADSPDASRSPARWMARKFGTRLFVWRAAIAPGSTAGSVELGPVLHLAQASLRPLEEPAFPLVEPLRSMQCKWPAAVKMVYPASWVLVQPEAQRVTHTSVNIANLNRGATVGLTTFAVLLPTAASEPEQLRDLYLSQIASSELGNALECAPPALHPPDKAPEAAGPERDDAVEVWVGTTTDKESRVELRMSVVRTRECWVLLATIGPTEWASAAAWMENKRAHELATDNLWLPHELRQEPADDAPPQVERQPK